MRPAQRAKRLSESYYVLRTLCVFVRASGFLARVTVVVDDLFMRLE